MSDPHQPITSVTLKSDGAPTSSIILLFEPQADGGRTDTDLYVTTSLDLRYENSARWRIQLSETHTFSADELLEFESELTDLEMTRHGVATLSSKVPGEFDLFIESTDEAGHIIARVSFIARAWAGPRKKVCFDNPFSYAFEIDPERLPSFVRDFRTFLTQCTL